MHLFGSLVNITIPLFPVLCLPIGLFVYSPFCDCIHSGTHVGLIPYTGGGYWFLFRLQTYGERNVAVYTNPRIAPSFWFPPLIKCKPVKTKTSLNYVSRFSSYRTENTVSSVIKQQSVNAL